MACRSWVGSEDAARRGRVTRRPGPTAGVNSLYIPLTTQNRQSPYEVALPPLPFLAHNSVANAQGLGSLPIVRLERRLGTLPDDVMVKIKRTLAFALELSSQD